MNFSTEHFVTLILQLSEEKLSLDRMQSWLNSAIDAIEADYLSVQKSCESSGYHEDSPAEIDHGLLGLEEYREAMGLVEDYLEVGEFAYLEEAANLAISASQNLTKASQENDERASQGLMDMLG